METTLKDISVEIGKDWGQTKQNLFEKTSAFERRDDFIRWLVEIKLDDEYSLNDLWNEFEKYEQSDEAESEQLAMSHTNIVIRNKNLKEK